MPREWPPVSVWWTALLQTLPPLGLLVAGIWLDRWLLIFAVWNADGLAMPYLLRAGWSRDLAWLVSAQNALGYGCLGVWLVWQADWRPHMWEMTPACYGITLATLLWWPATRRWCGLLPAEPDADE